MLITSLLANSDIVREIRHYAVRSGSFRDYWMYLLVVLGVVLLWAALTWWDRRQKQSQAGGGRPLSLWDELCRGHRLSDEEAALLRKTAEQNRLTEPAEIFVRPDLMRAAADSDTAPERPLSELNERLFGGELVA